jgi:MFS family permease
MNATSADARTGNAADQTRPLLQLSLVVFLGFLTMGIPIAVLPGHVNGVLGFGATLVGITMGAQSVVTLLTRQFAGTLADTRGGRDIVLKGLLVCAACGAIYWFSLAAPLSQTQSLALLLLGRALLGLGESLLITAATAWGIGLVGAERGGRVIAWSGIAMYAAMALGAPIGMWLNDVYGFGAVALAAVLAPVLAIVLASALSSVPPSSQPRLPFYSVLRLVWLPGVGVAMATCGFALLVAFASLLFAEKNWSHAAMALTVFGAAYIGVRLLLGGLPDRLGGARVAMISLLTEAVGQLLIWQAPSNSWALVGAALTGAGYSLIVPSFGTEVVRRVPPSSRGSAFGAFIAFWDLTMGLAAPLGAMVVGATYSNAFLVGAVGASVGFAVAAILQFRKRAN